MPLNDAQIEECYARYIREQDRYIKMAEVVYEKCLDIVQKKLTVRASVQRRAKNPKSFAEKLKKPEIRNKYNSPSEVFEKISDLAGVRVATYLESDRDIVVEELKKEFVGSSGSLPIIDKKDKSDKGKHYRATHCQVYLLEEDLGGANENLKGTTCEIQVCSLLAHVFNEIEHDLQYKPLSGNISPAETELIDQLGLLTKAGDITIKQLLLETDSRLNERTGAFSDVYDFVARMRQELKLQAGFSANAGQLFDEIIALGLNTPQSITNAIAGTSQEQINEVSIKEFNRLKKYLEPTLPDLLEDGSSDVLLAGLLKTHYTKIVEMHPTGRGMGRPSRLTQIATSYKKMIEASAVA
jgi:ppGpp synthetase/RelA/SpoT-type nucleotidyltranferase